MNNMLSLKLSSTVPSAVTNLNLGHNGSHFLISWMEPLIPNGQVNYLVNLFCTDLFRGTMSDLLTSEMTSDLEVTVTEEFLPYTRCLATVTPQTGAGQGSESNFTLTSAEEGKG